MTELQYTLEQDTPGRDVTKVMGRRTLAWVLDLVLYLAFAITLFALLAEYVDVPAGSSFLDACERLQAQDGDAAAGCVELGDRAYITSNADNSLQTLAGLGYFAFFVIVQGVLGGSPGKLLTGLRVVTSDGTRAGVGRSLVRTVLWIVDGAPWFAPIVGFVTGLTTTGHRRVGDMAAKTYVIARRDVGRPVTTGAAVMPPAQGAWGAPPPQVPPQTWGQPATPPPMAGTAPPPPAASTPPPPASAPGDRPSPAVDELTPDISGVPADEPAPPLVADTSAPTWQPPGLDDPSPTADDPGAAPGEPPATPEIDGPVDVAAPEVSPSDEWWSGPEADPGAAANAPEPEPEMPTWEDPSPTPDTTGDSWEPPTTPGADIASGAENTSPTAGPAPFAAPGADPVADAPTAPEPAPRPPPQWDQARNTYIQWEPADQKWLQWDEPAQRWKEIDS